MENFYIKTRSFDKYGTLIFSLLFMTVGFLQASSITFGKIIISIVQWPAVFLGLALLLCRLISFKHYLKTRGILLLVAFALSYALSSLWTIRYGYYENIRFLVFMTFQFGLLYATDANENPAESRRRLVICAYWYIACAALLSLISFGFMAAGYTRIFYPPAGAEGPIYYYGFMNGRLFGAYWDPNIAAAIAVVATLLSLGFMIKSRSIPVKILNACNIVLQVCYVTFSDSRTGRLCLIAGVTVLALLAAPKKKFFEGMAARVTACVAVIAVSVAAAYLAPVIIKNTYVDIVTSRPHTQEESEDGDDSTDSESEQSPDIIGDRGYDMSQDISNRRFDIWRGAVEIFETSPVLGVSRANILPYVDDNLPDSYLINNDYMRFESMHNMYFEILASQGGLGIILFVAFIISVIIGLIKNAKYIWQSEHFPLFALILSIAAAEFTASLVMAEVVYVTSPISTLFWLALGCINHHISCHRAQKEEK